MRSTSRDEMMDYYVCSDCYMAVEYGADSSNVEYPETWARDQFIETVNSIGKRGLWIYGGVCSDHNPGPDTYDDDGNETTVPCTYCGDTDPDNGMTTFSRSKCDMCEGLPGTRYRLYVG